MTVLESSLTGDPWLSPKQAADEVGHHTQTILKACRAGQITHSRAGRYGHIRIRISALLAWMRSKEVAGI